ncbi:hypothetical protein [Streptomyces sp. NPDC005281]|uniref:hypothetical protein n=1 Tax=Streptomyces sp. NPDC005281 TaxID=3155712 RepID=UPI0033BEA780
MSEAMTRKERQQLYAELRQREAERKARQVPFKADPSKKPASTGPKPQAPALDRRSGTRNLVIAGVDKAHPDDVYGRSARERSQLPNRPLTPGKYDQQKRRKSASGLTTFGPEFRVKGGNRKKKQKKAEPVARKGFVTEVPDRLKAYLAA